MKENKNLFIGFACGIILSGIVMFFFMEKQVARTTEQLQESFDAQQAHLIDSVRQSGLVNLMATLIRKAENEIAQNESGAISDGTIAQLVALSEGFKPYAIINPNDHLPQTLSPERGHLLSILNGMHMDSLSRHKMLTQISFARADLQNADLRGADLSGINLSHANLEGANLEGAVLVSANLHSAVLKGTNMADADLRLSDLTSADLSWANLKNAIMQNAIMNGAFLSSAVLRHANLQNVEAQRTIMHNAFFNQTDFSGADLLEAELDHGHFENTTMRNAFLVLTTFRETTLLDAILDSAVVKNDQWFNLLQEWNAKDLDLLQEKYRVSKEESEGRTKYVLLKN